MISLSEQEYFKRALSNFTYEAACGGAIRHLTNIGFTVNQIMENLSFPTSYERVQRTVWEHLLHTGVILLEEPGIKIDNEAFTYIKEYNKYGKASFRRIAVQQEQPEKICFREYCLQEENRENLADYLLKKCMENGEESAYISCHFGLCERDLQDIEKLSALLDRGQRDYIFGLPWEKKLCYHRLDKRMREIAVRLYFGGGYHECCYFMKTAEKVSF